MASVTAVTAFTRPSIIHQTFPGKPKFTEKDVKDLGGKVRHGICKQEENLNWC